MALFASPDAPFLTLLFSSLSPSISSVRSHNRHFLPDNRNHLFCQSISPNLEKEYHSISITLFFFNRRFHPAEKKRKAIKNKGETKMALCGCLRYRPRASSTHLTQPPIAQRCLLLGPRGSGKTTFLFHLKSGQFYTAKPTGSVNSNPPPLPLMMSSL